MFGREKCRINGPDKTSSWQTVLGGPDKTFSWKNVCWPLIDSLWQAQRKHFRHYTARSYQLSLCPCNTQVSKCTKWNSSIPETLSLCDYKTGCRIVYWHCLPLWYHGTFQKHFCFSIQTSLAYSTFSTRLKQSLPLLPINNLQGFRISQRPM